MTVVVLLGIPGRAAAHIAVASSTPAADSTVVGAVREIGIVFTQRVEAAYTDLLVSDESGRRFGGIVSGTDGRSFTLTLASALPGGRYTVHWRAAGRDGHIVTDSFHFAVDAPPPPAEAAVTPDPGTVGRAPITPHESIVSKPAAVVVRWLTFSAILLTIGSGLFRTAVLGRAAARFPDATDWDALVRATGTVACAASAGVLVLLIPRLLVQSAEIHGPAAMWDVDGMRTLIAGTLWGRGWVIQLVAGVICFGGSLRATRPGGWAALLLGSVLLAFAPAFSGHAAAIEQSVVITVAGDALHVFAASAWIGSLAALFIVVLAKPRTGAPAVAGMILFFSPLALLGATFAVITGSVAALAHIGPLSDLWRTPYGRALSLKLAMLGVTATAGFINWRLIRPTLGTDRTTQTLRGSSSIELFFALLILLFTAILVALPTP